MKFKKLLSLSQLLHLNGFTPNVSINLSLNIIFFVLIFFIISYIFLCFMKLYNLIISILSLFFDLAYIVVELKKVRK